MDEMKNELTEHLMEASRLMYQLDITHAAVVNAKKGDTNVVISLGLDEGREPKVSPSILYSNKAVLWCAKLDKEITDRAYELLEQLEAK